MLSWQWRSFADLSNQELYDILALREKVFTLEQKCTYNDLDYIDQKAMHLLGVRDQQLVAYLRVIPQDILYPGAVSFGRVLTIQEARGQGISKAMVQETLRYLKQNHNTAPIIISAQLYLEKF